MTPLPGKSFQLAGALALSAIVAAMVSGGRGPEPAPAASAPVVAKFDARWDMPDGPPLLKKQDRLPLPLPTPVQPETVAMVQPQERVEEPKTKPKKAEPVRTAERDVCTRHGMHKISIRHGRSWRCRK
jgi:outer membrane biosynthesis protein TonB